MINEIYIPEEIQNDFIIPDNSGSIQELNRINIFVGPNNSAKSRFLRWLFINQFEFQLRKLDFNLFTKVLQTAWFEIEPILKRHSVNDISGPNVPGVKGYFNALIAKLQKASLPKDSNLIRDVEAFLNSLKNFTITGGSPRDPGVVNSPNWDAIVRDIPRIAQSALLNFEEIASTKIPTYEKIYIPILRGLRPVQLKNNYGFDFYEDHDNYKHRTIKDYFYNKVDGLPDQQKRNDEIHIFSGLTLYTDIKRMLLGTLKQREKVRQFEEFLSTTFFKSQPVSLTPNIDEDCLYITIADEDRPIYNLGDGIQNIIILLYPLFLNGEKDLLYFIEEPEISLHPGFQRLLIDTILKPDFKNVQFFFTTHSNHFLDMTLDHDQISLYNFQRIERAGEAQYKIMNTKSEDIKLLNSLGVRNSSVFLSNCTIWVEGITDRLYLNKYMEAYQKNILGGRYETDRLKEDLHYSFIEYAGANLAHYSFEDDENWQRIKASKISSRILLIADGDNTAQNTDSAKSRRLEELSRVLGDHLIVLPCREIENTLSPEVIKRVVQEWEGDAKLDFDKFDNQNYENEYLGSFIRDNVSGLKRKYTEDAGSGTLSNKLAFCKSSIDHIEIYSDLSPIATDIATKMYNFVTMHNK